MDDSLHLAALLGERDELLAREAPSGELDELASRSHGKAASSTGTVLHIEAHATQAGVRLVAISACEENGGGHVRYRVAGVCLASHPLAKSRDPSQRWPKGQRLVVEGHILWEASLLPPCVQVESVAWA